jgi:hypothetical protein
MKNLKQTLLVVVALVCFSYIFTASADIHFTRTGEGGTVDETVTVVSSPTYTIDDPDIRNIAFDSRVAAITVTFDSEWIATAGNFVRVKDWYYSASTYNITFLTEGAELIDLETEAVMGSGGQDGQAWTILTDGTNLGVY